MRVEAALLRRGDRIVIYDAVCRVDSVLPGMFGWVNVRAAGWRMQYRPETRVVVVDREVPA